MFLIGRKADAENGVTVRVLDFADERAIGHVPDFEFAAARRNATAGGEEFAIGAEIESEDAIGERRFFGGVADFAFELPGGRDI